MTQIREKGIKEARKQFATLLETAHRGQATVITHHGIPYAAVVPTSRLTGQIAGITLKQLRGSGKKFWRHNAAKWTNKLREEWNYK